MKLYHGTTVQCLTSLSASSFDRDGKSVLYLTDNWAYSLFYIRDREINFVTCGVGPDGIVHYDEKFPNQLSVLYRGMSGYIYEVETVAEKTKVEGIYVTDTDVKVTGVTYIPDAYEAILQEVKKGNIDLLKYENLTEQQKAMNHEGIVRMIRDGSLSSVKELFYRKYFPAAWDAESHIK